MHGRRCGIGKDAIFVFGLEEGRQGLHCMI